MTAGEAIAALELDGEVTPAAIKRQYRKLSLRHHPDRFREAAEKKKAHRDFLRIKDAYDFLRNNPPRASEGRGAPEPRAPGDDLRAWKRQFDQEQREEERRERERDRARASEKDHDDLLSWVMREWRRLLKVNLFIGGVAFLGAVFEPEHAWMFGAAWFLLGLFSAAFRFGG